MVCPWAVRRELIKLIGQAAAIWPIAAYAQQTSKLPVVGFPRHNASSARPWAAAFETRLGELGWTEGRTVESDYRWSEGRLPHTPTNTHHQRRRGYRVRRLLPPTIWDLAGPLG